jgi:acyl-CoA thioesterase I
MRLRRKWHCLSYAFVVGACSSFVFNLPIASAESHVSVIAAFGDSLTAGLGLSDQAAFPAQLETWLRRNGKPARVINAGKSGDTTASALPRLDEILDERPNLVILELGTNDALRGVHPDITRSNLATMITKIRGSGAKILLTGALTPPIWGNEYKQTFDRIYPDLARSYNVPLYPFFLYGVAQDRKLNLPDGFHPNEAGVRVIVEYIAPVAVNTFLNDPIGAEAPLPVRK